MDESIPRSTHDGVLRIGAIELECHVLEDQRRVFSSRDLLRAFNLQSMQRDQPRILARFLEKIQFISIGNEQLRSPLIAPIRFVCKGKGGSPRKGYMAELIPEICNATLELANKRILPVDLREAAESSRKLLNSFAKIGVIALVDEATGYQELRDKQALQKILDSYLLKEYAAWAKRFPDEFYKEIFRLRGWEWQGMNVNRPGVVGSITKNIVYRRLAPGILRELETRNPPVAGGHRRVRHHQYLTGDVGHPALAQHLYALLAMMRISSKWSQFYHMVERAFPAIGETLLLPFDEPCDDESSEADV